MAQHGLGSVVADAGVAQIFARQIEPAALGILGEIAQDVGELERAAELLRDTVRGRRVSLPKMRTDKPPTALATRSQ